MNLALQHWPQRCPIGLNVITQVVAVVAHVNGHAVINLSRSLVPQRSWIPIVANRSVRGVPNLNLLPRPAVATQHRLSLAELDRKSTRLNSSHPSISYAVFCLKKKIKNNSK